MPFTLRLVYHSLRAALRAGPLFLIAWVVLVPATDLERERLSAVSDTAFPAGLRSMRTAQIIVAVAPSKTYELIGEFVAPKVPPYMIRFAMLQMAAGNVIPPSATPVEEPFSARDIEGPRFIRVD